MNTEDLNRKARLIKQLLAQAESEKALGNLAAAEAFAAKVAELCDKYRLSVAEMPEGELRDTIRDERWSLADAGERDQWKRSLWLTNLAYGVAYGHRCAACSFRGVAMVSFVGLAQDVEVCRAMMSILTRAARACFANYKAEHKGAKLRPYMNGFALAIQRRYKAQRDAMEQDGNALALMRVVDQLIQKSLACVRLDKGKYARPVADGDFRRGLSDGERQDLRARLLNESEGKEQLQLGA